MSVRGHRDDAHAQRVLGQIGLDLAMHRAGSLGEDERRAVQALGQAGETPDDGRRPGEGHREAGDAAPAAGGGAVGGVAGVGEQGVDAVVGQVFEELGQRRLLAVGVGGARG
jgi:hypothetical protein